MGQQRIWSWSMLLCDPGYKLWGCPTGCDILRVWMLTSPHGQPYSDFRHTPQRESTISFSPTTNRSSLVCRGDCHGKSKPGHPIFPPKVEKYPSLVKTFPMRQYQTIILMLAQWQLHTVSLETCMSGQGLSASLYTSLSTFFVVVKSLCKDQVRKFSESYQFEYM